MATKTVFLSSTARDLPDHRAKVYDTIQRLGYRCVRMEDFGAIDSVPVDFCRATVRECDIFVGIVGLLYGSTPPDDDRSFTEIEYEAAVASNRPRLMFLSPESFSLAEDLRREAEKTRDRQNHFRERIREERICDTFESSDDLARRVAEALARRITHAERAEEAIVTLSELMHEPEVRDAVVRFRTEFQNACQQIRLVADNKEVHDLFHEMQFQSYNQLLLVERRGGDEYDPEELEAYADQFEGLVERLRDVGPRAAQTTAAPEWLAELEEAGRRLRAAVDATQSDQWETDMKRAIRLIRAVLDIEPSRVNTRLHTAAQALRLDELVQAMSVIRAKVAAAELTEDKLRQFDEGVAALEALNADIEDLTRRHDRWQEVENHLRRIEGIISRDVDELELSWPKIRKMVEGLQGDGKGFEDYVTRLERALNSGKEQEARRSFVRFRRQAARVFLHVDTTLKKLCDQLREVGHPLTSVLELMQ